MSEQIKIPVPYNGIKYEIRINHVIKPMVGYHVSIFKNGIYAAGLKGVCGTIEDAKKEGSRMIVADYNLSSAADAQNDSNLATAQETSPYGKGTIKLTWVDKNDNSILHSQMYQSIEEALKNTYEKKNWLIFKLKQSSNDSYDWELLPYGKSKAYTRGMYISDSPVLKLIIFGLAATGAYFIGKAIYNKLKDNSYGSLPSTPTVNPSATSVPKP